MSAQSKAVWQIWIDTGGTFTDCIAVDPEGCFRNCKVLSSGCLRDRIADIDHDGRIHLRGATRFPAGFLKGFRISRLADEATIEIVDHDAATGSLRLAGDDASAFAIGASVELRSGEEAPLLATRLVTSTALGDEFPPLAMRLATTRGTNALLERRGARLLHITTAGLEDLLTIGDQRRPDLFALRIEREEPLPEEQIGVHERLDADGSVIEELQAEELDACFADMHSRGIACASIALLHGHRNPVHEITLEKMLRDAGFEYVARSSALSPFQGLLRRSQTAVTDAYIGPVISGYLDRVSSGLGQHDSTLHVMTSAGGLVSTDSYRPMDSLLSGPAGGVVGAAMSGRIAGTDKVIAFDMGGTSTDVSRFDGDFEYVFEHQVGPVSLAAPALAIETVAAGGGSLCRVDQGRLVVGPESAGAHPGPASYGAGGPLSLTDVNMLLGRLVPSRFPIPIDVEAARRQLAILREDLPAQDAGSDEEILEGLVRIADERMAEAIRHISVRKGIDPAGYSLVAFGGAGGQHACRVAELLGMSDVILPGNAGLLSAVGLGHASIERFSGREVLRPIDETADLIVPWLEELAAEARRALIDEGVRPVDIEQPRRMIELRYLGQDAAIEIEARPDQDLRAEFEQRYYDLFSYRPENRGIEVVSLRVVCRSRRGHVAQSNVAGQSAAAESAAAESAAVQSAAFQDCFLDGRWRNLRCYEAADLVDGMTGDGVTGDGISGDGISGDGISVAGPVLIHQEHSTLVVPSGWTAHGLPSGGVRLRWQPGGETVARRDRPRAVELELMSHRFSSIAREMGEMLRRTAISTNIKERGDYSCTLLDPAGRLVVNAPHIPVHLGAMGLCTRELVAYRAMAPGDVVITNHPAYGGSHLPDVTLAAPVYRKDYRKDNGKDTLLGYVACRAHHAEIGGISPGSVPPDAQSLAEEGVVIPPTLLVEDHQPKWHRIKKLLTAGPFPTRMLDDNLADLRAMLAAITRGRQALTALAGALGGKHVIDHMHALRHQAEQQISNAFARLPDGVCTGRQKLDDLTPIVATFTINGDRAVLDFDGSGDVHPGNLNATPAIVHSAVMYVMRLLVDANLPLNEGLLEPIEVRIPPGMLNPPFVEDPCRCPAVVGGNVETSQRVVDTLLEALRLAGCSQGTMNNLSFGNQDFGYYETVAGGSGAGEGFDGCDGVHTHMTNTRITDPEVLEHRYPVRLHRFAIRAGSGGAGRWRGGHGLIRDIEFLDNLELSILSQHRVSAPYGMAGGGDGALGRQFIIHQDGTCHELKGIDGCTVTAGDHLVLETPGGGGFGNEES